MTSFTIGTVSYLNSVPLVAPLETQGHRIVRAVPSVLAPMLARGECDAALIPVVEWFRGVGANLISDACIASSHDVRSVLVFHRGPVEQMKRIALDQSSRTSVALTQVVLKDLYGVSPETTVLSPDLATMLEHNDGALLIGDAALIARRQCAALRAEILDLGAAWTRLTGLPFVYAAWISRRGLGADDEAELAAALGAARDAGLGQIEELARTHATEEIDAATIQAYYTSAIEYRLTAAHRSGLDEFRRRCAAHGLVQATG